MKALYDQDGYDEFVESLYEKHLDDMDWDADVELDVLDELIDVSKTNTFFDEGTQKEYMDAVEAMGNIRREHVNTVREEDETKGFARIVEKTGICELQSVDIHGFECHFCEAKYSDEKYIIIYQKDTHIRDIIDNEEEWSNFRENCTVKISARITARLWYISYTFWMIILTIFRFRLLRVIRLTAENMYFLRMRRSPLSMVL